MKDNELVPFLARLDRINESLRKLGFGDSVSFDNPGIGAIEGLTMHLDERLKAIEVQLERIADALESRRN